MSKDIIELANPGKHCAPGIEGIGESCYKLSDLQIIAQAYNDKHTNAISESIINAGNFQELYNIIDEKMKTCNGKEVCFSEKVGLSDDFVKNIFKPIGPVNNEWLSNIDIANVMEQYERCFKNFTFYGPCSSDLHLQSVKRLFEFPDTFDDMIHGIKIHDSENIKKNKTSEPEKSLIGIIFNTDPHNKGGAHWVTLVISIIKNTVFFDYFDSVGKMPNDNIAKSIVELIEKCIKYYSSNGEEKDIHFRVNRTQHQSENSECGVYSIIHILKMLNNEKWENIVKNVITDKEIQKLRATLLFRH
jgi:Ulp1 protease family, C-terminal catalytic domain